MQECMQYVCTFVTSNTLCNTIATLEWLLQMWEQFDLQVLLEESEEKRWGLKAAVLLQQHWLLVSEVVAQNERESYLGERVIWEATELLCQRTGSSSELWAHMSCVKCVYTGMLSHVLCKKCTGMLTHVSHVLCKHRKNCECCPVSQLIVR